MLTFICVRQQRRVSVAAILQVSGDLMDGPHYILVDVGAGGLCRPNAFVIPVPVARRGGRRSSPNMWRSRGEEGLIPVLFPPTLPAGSHREPGARAHFALPLSIRRRQRCAFTRALIGASSHSGFGAVAGDPSGTMISSRQQPGGPLLRPGQVRGGRAAR